MQSSFGFLLAVLLSASLALAQKAGPFREPDVPYIPTAEIAVKARLELAEVKSSDIVYDLGCGDGRIVIAAVKSYVAGGVGIDIDPVLIREAKNNARQVGIDSRVESRQQDLVPGEPPRGNGGYSVPVSGCRPAPAPVAGNPCGKSSSKTTLTTTTISAAAVSFSGSFRNASSCAVQPG